MKKKLCTLLITLTLTCSLLIGCGNSDTVDTAPTSSESARETATVDTSESSDETATTDSQASVDKTTTADAPESTDESTTDAAESAEETSTTDAQESPKENTDTTAEEVIDDSAEENFSETESTEPAPVLTPEPLPEPVAVYTYTDMATTMYATQTVNIRNLPNTDGEKLGSLSINQEVAVTGQCNETGWYMFNYNGQTAFVSNSYLSVEKPEITPPANETPTTTNSSEAFPYELYVMYYDNMGYPYFYYIGLNSLYNTPENQAKEIACRDARSSYVFDHFEREDGCCSFNPYWGPVGKHKYQGDPIYVEFIDECNGEKLPAPESRGIYTAGLGW